jgi:mono/diheme cytochrome c family protein
VAEGTAADFDAGVDQVSADTGVTSDSIIESATEEERDPALRASMIASSNMFVDGAFVPGTSSAGDTTDEIGSCIARGGLAYDNWTKPNAGGDGVLPLAEPNKDYLRCKACHGWDQLADTGGYARRSRKSSRPNAGYKDPNMANRVISDDPTFGNHPTITAEMVLHAGTGRSWGEGSGIFDTVDPWGPGAQKGNEHPDLSQAGVNAGDVLPTDEQVRCLTAFLNHPEARANKVFAGIKTNTDPSDPVPAWCTSSQCSEYTLVATADAARGDAWYHDPAGGSCVTCHGEPEDETGPIADGPAGGLLAFLRNDGKYSEFQHKVQWGESGNDLMSRANMNYPTAANVADVLAYLQQKVEAPPPVDLACIGLGGLAYDNWTKLNAGGGDVLPLAEPNKDYLRCKACHGWDQLAIEGGYARRSRKSSRPNAGYMDPNTVSRVISADPTFGNHPMITAEMILHTGTGRSWGEGSGIFDALWGPGAQKGNEHPDLSQTGVNAGDVLPTDEQVRCLTEFLNYAEARADAIFADIKTNSDPSDPVPAWCNSAQCSEYTLVATADAARGDAWYHDPAGGNCATCHGEPEDAEGPIADGPAGGLLLFLRNDGKYSEFQHKVQWGESGNALMTRENMNNPTAAQVADVLAYLQQRIDGQVTGRPAANDDTASTDQDVLLDNLDVLANDSDPNDVALTVTAFDALSVQGGTVNCTAAGICSYQPPVGFTGTDSFTYEISNGSADTDSATVMITVNNIAPAGDPVAGQARYDTDCFVCHAAGSHDTTTALGASDLGGRGTVLIDTGRLVNNLGDTNPTMAGITLTDQEILDMAAFLDPLVPPPL